MRYLLCLFSVALLVSCSLHDDGIPPAQQSGELVVVTRNSPTTYYQDSDGNSAGLEYDLVELFAAELGLKAKFIVAGRFDDIIPTLVRHQAHLAAAGLTVTPERERWVRFGPVYQTVRQQLCYNTDSLRPRSLKDVVGQQIEVVAGSSYVETLKAAQKKIPALAWKEIDVLESEELLEKVANGELDYSIADSHIVDITSNYYPTLAAAFDVSGPQQLAWAFPRDGDKTLMKKAQDFFARIQQDGTLKRLLDRYYGHIQRLHSGDVVGILDKKSAILPQYRKYFQRGQELTGVDWRLLAAMGYQESQWDPLATSPTGVRGMMMLTNDTADRMKVSNRLDPKQSIVAGARYLVLTRDMLPQRIEEPDRTWLALAAYNSGYGHVEDARILAQQMKLNPDSWADLKKVMPLLSKSAYYSKAKHGYARGGESVIFVENIRTYYDILNKFEKPYQPIFAGNVKLGKTRSSRFSLTAAE